MRAGEPRGDRRVKAEAITRAIFDVYESGGGASVHIWEDGDFDALGRPVRPPLYSINIPVRGAERKETHRWIDVREPSEP